MNKSGFIYKALSEKGVLNVQEKIKATIKKAKGDIRASTIQKINSKTNQQVRPSVTVSHVRFLKDEP